MAAGAILFFGPWTARQVAAMFIGVGLFFLGMGVLLVLGAVEKSSVPNLFAVAVVVLCLGALLAGFGVFWFRKARPPDRELVSDFQ